MIQFKYTWVPAYAATAQRLLKERNSQLGLIEVLKQIGADGFHDEDEKGNDITLQEIDGFTFLCYLNKYGDVNRKKLLNNLCKLWEIDVKIKDVCGVPSANPQRLRMFPFKKERNNNEVTRLWDFFQSIIDDKATDAAFADVLTIRNVGKQKITEVLFLIKPDEYLCLNSVVKPYLEQTENISCEFNSFSEYRTLCQRISNQLKKPFPEISYQAFLYSDFRDKPVQYFKIGSTAGNTGESRLPEMIPNHIISVGWADIGNLEDMDPLNKTSIQEAMQQEGYYDKNMPTISRKAGEILRFYKDIKPFDIVCVVQGATVKAIGRVNGHHYVFEESLGFPHCKTVDWIDENVSGLSIEEGLQTSVWQCSYPETIKKIKDYIQDKKVPIVQPKKSTTMSLNTILYGPPGTGKTYNTIIKAAKIITGKDLEYNEAKAVFEPLLGDQVEFITFHQNYSYEDFVIGLRPNLKGSQLAFEKHEGVFYKICERGRNNYKAWKEGLEATEPKFENVLYEYLKPLQTAGGEIEVKLEIGNKNYYITDSGGDMLQYRSDSSSGESLNIDTIKALYSEGKSPTDSKHIYYTPLVKALKVTAERLKREMEKVELKNYVLIIDEINRANISRVFGELITLLEKDKRLGNKHQMLVTLSNGERFSVPKNLYVIGTMNTADKSIALIDIALRRRFVFENMYPRPEVIDELVDSPYNEFLKALNSVILEKKGADFLIGHSYLMAEEDEAFDFLNAMNQKIIPLLNEYFYNQRNISVLSVLQGVIETVPGYTMEKDDYTGVICKAKA
jgi:5-methylcytosine-specific restriction protein B